MKIEIPFKGNQTTAKNYLKPSWKPSELRPSRHQEVPDSNAMAVEIATKIAGLVFSILLLIGSAYGPANAASSKKQKASCYERCAAKGRTGKALWVCQNVCERKRSGRGDFKSRF